EKEEEILGAHARLININLWIITFQVLVQVKPNDGQEHNPINIHAGRGDFGHLSVVQYDPDECV
ncbi:MAG: hypothetical protein AAF597_15945, partial [Bacteroidota bacterium]